MQNEPDIDRFQTGDFSIPLQLTYDNVFFLIAKPVQYPERENTKSKNNSNPQIETDRRQRFPIIKCRLQAIIDDEHHQHIAEKQHRSL